MTWKAGALTVVIGTVLITLSLVIDYFVGRPWGLVFACVVAAVLLKFRGQINRWIRR